MVFTIGGLPVDVNISTLLLAFLIWLSGFAYLKEIYPQASRRLYQMFSVLAAVGILASVIFHEIGHAVVADSLGLTIAGGGINFLAAYVQISVTENYTAQAALLVSLAGPLVNLLFGVVVLIFVRLMDESVLENSLQFITYMSVKLGLLNLLPISMLDGGHALKALVQMLTGNDQFASTFIIAVSVCTMIYFLFIRKSEKIGFIDRFLRAK